MAQNWTNASEYLRIQPSRDSIDFETAVETFQTLTHLSPATASGHSQQTDAAASGEQCTYDCLITAIPTDTGTDLRYYFGVDSAFGLAALQPHLRNLFPDNYRLTTQTDVPLLADRPDIEWSHAVEAVGLPECYSDWDTQLDSGRERAGIWPSLTTTLEALQATETPALVQICFRPTSKLEDRLEKREEQLKKGFLRPVAAFFEGWMVGNTRDEKPKQEHRYKIRNRITHLENKIPDAYDVSLRVLIGAGANAGATAHTLANTLTGLSGEYYTIDGSTHTDTDPVIEAIRNRDVVETEYRYAREKLPLTKPSSRGIVADATEIGSLCLVDGAELTEPAIRGLGTQSDQSGIATPPPPRILEEYDNGFPLGHLRNSEGVVEETRISLPPKYQSRHTLITAATGGGKTVLTQNAILANQERTDGADILIEPKGGEMVATLLRSYYARHGNLDDVYYFDCSETLPALSVLDIRPELAAGIPRESAVPNAIDHYIDILRALYGKEAYNQANRSRDVIRFLLKAQFDSVHGEDAFEHSDLKSAAIQMEAEQAPPAVSDSKLEQNLSGIVDEKTEMFSNIMGGVSSRLDAVSRDNRLRALFNHVPGSESERFDLATLLDEDALIILDMGHLKSSTQQAITQVVLANLWSALKRRARHTDRAPGADPPLVNLYLEEAATFAELDLLGELLDQSRSFGVGLTLVTQYPGQFKHANSATHERILNNVGTTVAGYIQHDRALAEAMATDKQSPEDVKRVLNSQAAGSWLVSLPPTFGEPEPDLFQVQSLSLPAGHPDSTQFDSLPLSEIETAVAERTATVTEQYGIDVTELSVETTTTETATDETDGPVTVDSPIAYTKRMPPTVAYDADRHALECTECGAVQDPTRNGMLNAIRCHSALADVDSANIPICEVSLTLSEAEHDRATYTHRQLLFLQTVYNAQSLQYDAPYYDIVHDSMLRLREYLGIDQAAVRELIDDGLLKRDGQKPHLLYTVTGDGRTMLNESHREGVDYGHGVGDLEETSEHRMMVETLVRYLRAEYVADDDSSVTEVCRYYEPGTESSPTVSAASAMDENGDLQADADQTDRRRFDVVGLDDAGEIVIAGEAERCNNDVQEAAVADFDKMAAYEPAESIWVVPSRSDAAEIVAALDDPPAGKSRVGTTYSANTRPEEYGIDTAGLSSMRTINTLRDELPE